MNYSLILRLLWGIVFMLINNIAYTQTVLNADNKNLKSLTALKNEIKLLENKQNFSKDSLRIELLNKIAILYKKESKDSALFYANTALSDAKKLNYNDLIAVSYYNIGNIYEYYKETKLAEDNFLAWYEIRKTQDKNKYRWALSGLRKFYSKYKQIDKLEKIENEWMLILDKQYDEKYISVWNESYYQSPDNNYWLSMQPIFLNLIELKEYFLAEKFFAHMVQKCPGCLDWTAADMLYFQVEKKLLENRDTATLSIWYEHWFKTLEKYSPSKEITLSTFIIISSGFIGKYCRYPDFAEKYYQKMLDYTYKVGGNKAVYKLFTESLNFYRITYYESIKFNFLALQLCISINDKNNTKKHYNQLDVLIGKHSEADKSVIKKVIELLDETKGSTNDKRLKKWCEDSLKKLNNLFIIKT